ncbi:N-acetylmuramoyl-L-alanine amidase [Parasphingopyxis lamellibrachiae]|uniref:N-acetylmuramoyl-L-alanine amidase n=2 Tax=Parasphingopyxis lamellibrachiae TaxID=680125 RepID=A0A3D9FGI8_9SPHN|nr:N-acetylmuramoyl-L-alanine amidase [Parasphingopyxis lamellibrachiae]
MMSLCWTKRGEARQYGTMSLLFALFAIIGWQPALATAIEAVDVTPERITVQFDDYVENASAFVLENPYRIAIDVAGARAGQGSGQAGPVRAVRQGQYNPQTARLVLDLARPAIFGNGSFSDDGRTFTLDIQPVSQLRFASAANAGRASFLPPMAFRARPPRGRGELTVRLPRATPAGQTELPEIQGPRGRPLVVIDAGHGGHDPGAISPFGNRHEKDATLAIALATRDALLASGRVRVALTRSDDRFLVLRERYEIARRLGGELFISIHADSAENSDAHGATIYTLSEVASDRETARLAGRENAADVINGVNLGGADADVRSILIDLTQRETMNISARFASLLRRQAGSAVPFRSDFHRSADFAVLKAPDMPSILFESGYLTNASDARRLFSREGQRAIANGLATAIQTHFARSTASTD